MTQEITLVTPHDKEILGDGVYNYGDGFIMPFQHYVRYAFVNYLEAFEAGATFRIPNLGVLTTAGRAYSFDTTEQYRKAKDYPERITGSWG